MVTIEYGPDGQTFSDFELENIVQLIKQYIDKNISHHTYMSSELLVLALRVAIKKGILPHDQVQMKFKDQIIPFDKNGYLSSYPEGFCDHLDNYLDNLIK